MRAVEVRKEIAEIGQQFNPDVIGKSIALYAGEQASVTPPAAEIVRDLDYGPDARHRLDVFAPRANGKSRPVLMFVHGGGFIAGDKGAPDAPFYNNVGLWAVRQGYVGVNITYRLAPQHPYPAGGQDVGAAVAWVRENISQYGGDPKAIFLMGQSAGAAHVATYVTRTDFHPESGPGVRAALLMSGIYDIPRAERNNFLQAYFGTEEKAYPAMSTLGGLVETRVPLLCSIAEFDPIDFMDQAMGLHSAMMVRHGRLARMLYLRGHNHISTVLQMGLEYDTLGPEIAAFIEDVVA